MRTHLYPPPHRAPIVPILVTESLLQEPLLVTDKALLQDYEECKDDEQRSHAGEQEGDAGNEEDGPEVHGITAPAIKAVANQRGGFGERLDRSRCCLERSRRPHEDADARCH